jgi:hypothetical protein
MLKFGARWRRPGAAFLLVCMSAFPACSRSGRCSELEAEVEGDSSHSIKVSPEKVKQAVGGAYRVHGTNHDHLLLLKDEDMRRLESGASVTVRTTSTNAHMHEVTIRCKQ